MTRQAGRQAGVTYSMFLRPVCVPPPGRHGARTSELTLVESAIAGPTRHARRCCCYRWSVLFFLAIFLGLLARLPRRLSGADIRPDVPAFVSSASARSLCFGCRLGALLWSVHATLSCHFPNVSGTPHGKHQRAFYDSIYNETPICLSFGRSPRLFMAAGYVACP